MLKYGKKGEIALEYKEDFFSEVKIIYDEMKDSIEKRLDDFKNMWLRGNDMDIYVELAFCVLTPQSKAKNAWSAISKLRDDFLLLEGSEEDIVEHLNVVRFKNNKAKNLVLLRGKMSNSDGVIAAKQIINSLGDPNEKREWLVQNIRGIGYKEASHFLRNIGFGDEIAILDRHILKNLVRLGVIEEVPKTITRKRYMEIEKKMIDYSGKIEIPMDHLDLLLWYLEAGEIFK